MVKEYLSVNSGNNNNDMSHSGELMNHLDDNDTRTLNLSIRLSNVQIRNAMQSPCRPFWITYEFAGAVVQSNEFNIPISTFETKEDEFQISINQNEVESFFHANKIKLYACQEGHILGEAEIDLFSILLIEKGGSSSIIADKSAKRLVTLKPSDIDPNKQGIYDVHGGTPITQPTDNQEFEKDGTIVVQLDLHLTERDDIAHTKTNQGVQDGERAVITNYLDETTQDMFLFKNKCDSTTRTSDQRTDENLMEKANALAKAELELDKRKQRWDEFRILEERKFQAYLRKKEESLQNHLQEQMQQKALDQMNKINSCRSEYNRLEAKLKSALSDIEAKEREMNRTLAANNTTFIQKVTELDLKHKLIQEEARHTVGLEKTKNEGMVERMQGCEKVALELKRRALIAETEVEQLRNKFKNSNEAKATQELQMLRHRMVDIKDQLQREQEEKDKLLSQRDEYRQAAHKLAKMVRKEREKYNSNVVSKTSDKERQELNRIQNELLSILAESGN